jgi:hypothetical protein
MTEPLRPTDWYHDPGREPGVAVLQPKDDPFYQYTDSLAKIPPGTVLKARGFPYCAFGVPTWLKATQLLYRSTSRTGNPLSQRHLGHSAARPGR